MGQCYYAHLTVRLRKEQTEENVHGLLRQWMREREAEEPGVNWTFDKFAERGITPDTLDGVFKILLGFHQGEGESNKADDGSTHYVSSFHASYGWAFVMYEAFKAIAFCLDEGSELFFDDDEGRETYEIRIGPTGESEVWENHVRHCN